MNVPQDREASRRRIQGVWAAVMAGPLIYCVVTLAVAAGQTDNVLRWQGFAGRRWAVDYVLWLPVAALGTAAWTGLMRKLYPPFVSVSGLDQRTDGAALEPIVRRMLIHLAFAEVPLILILMFVLLSGALPVLWAASVAFLFMLTAYFPTRARLNAALGEPEVS